jgi:hypothetical protein
VCQVGTCRVKVSVALPGGLNSSPPPPRLPWTFTVGSRATSAVSPPGDWVS